MCGKGARMNEIPYGYCHCGCGEKTSIATRNDKHTNRIKGEPMRFLVNHHWRIQPRQDVNERFWSKVAITANPDKCWEWQARIMDNGYGEFSFEGSNHLASRVAWILTNGEIHNNLFVLH